MAQQEQNFPHLQLVELYNDGILHECAIMKQDTNGDLYFIRIDNLDEIDRARLRQILSRRDAHRYPLWDLMDQRTLPNGMKALEFFHQYVKVRGINGKVWSPTPGKRGVGYKKADIEKQLAAQAAKAKKAATE